MRQRWQLALVVSGAIAFWAILVFAYFQAARHALWAEVREHLMSIAQAVALSIDPEAHQQVVKEGREDSPLYQQLTEQLQRFAHALLPEVREKGTLLVQESIYTLVPSHSKTWRFALDSGIPYDIDGDGEIDEDEDKAHLGEPYDVSDFPEMLRCFLEGRPTADTELTEDKWGVWLSGYAPVKDASGRVVAVVGVDFNVTSLRAKEAWLRRMAWLVFAILSVLTLGAARLIERLAAAKRDLQAKAEALAQAKADWELTFDLVGTGVAVLDSDFRIVQVNPALCQLVGKAAEELLHKHCCEVLHPEAPSAKTCPYLRALERGETVQREVVLPDGRIWLFHAQANLVHGHLQRIVHAVHDVTKERRAQQLLEQTERLVTIGQMAAGVAHEINNPLNAIVGMAELLLDKVADEELKGMLDNIREQALRIGRITRNLLTFARPRPQEMNLLNLNEVVREALNMKDYRLRSNNIAVVLDLQEPLPPVQGDKTQLLQVLLNLVNNAEEAMSEQGGGTLTIATVAEGDVVRLTVSDTGKGIPPEHLPHIFDPFFTTKPVGKGTGLGLAIVYGIVTAHGGKISAQNRSEGGAQFVVELPAAVELSSETQPSHSSAPTSERPAERKLRMLVIDDEPSIVATLKAMLQRDGHEVQVARSGEEARRLLASNDYDAILCDLRMPNGGGEELFRWLKEQKPLLARRFVVMTGELSLPKQAIFEEHAVPILHKPFRRDDLRRVLNACLSEGSVQQL